MQVIENGKKVDFFSEKKRGRVLDIPAGFGREAAHLGELGFATILFDLFPRPSEKHPQVWVRGDATKNLPFANDRFDYVLTQEGIEHFEDQALFLKECARVLKPRGTLVLTTPNITNIRSRVSYMLTCQRTPRRGLINEIQTRRVGKATGWSYHGHAFLIDYFRLRYLLRFAGFDKIQVFTDRYSPTSIAMAWLIPAMFIASRISANISLKKFQRKYKDGAGEKLFDEITSHVFSKAVLFGKRMIIVAQKS